MFYDTWKTEWVANHEGFILEFGAKTMNMNLGVLTIMKLQLYDCTGWICIRRNQMNVNLCV